MISRVEVESREHVFPRDRKPPRRDHLKATHVRYIERPVGDLIVEWKVKSGTPCARGLISEKRRTYDAKVGKSREILRQKKEK